MDFDQFVTAPVSERKLALLQSCLFFFTLLSFLEALYRLRSIIMSETMWVVHKFGGTSVGDASAIQKCVDIIHSLLREKRNRVAIVVSAMGGKPKITDLLLDLVHDAANLKINEMNEKLQLIEKKHEECVNQLLSSSEGAEKIMDTIKLDLKNILDICKAVQLMRVPHEQILELVSGYGELWSANILTEVLKKSELPFVFLNAREVLIVDNSDENIGTKVLWKESEQKLHEVLTKKEEDFFSDTEMSEVTGKCLEAQLPNLVVTGYIASTINGVATTLKRDGSDFSASIFGKLLNAASITIWTDVSGVYSADPRRVPEAQIISKVSYNEAIELAYFGAKVIHPKTMAPAIMAQIPIYIRNTFEPTNRGTRIYLSSSAFPGGSGKREEITHAETELKGERKLRERTVCGFTSIDNIALLNLEGTGMLGGVPGTANRLFGALKNMNISVMYIAQSSSEHNICFAIKSSCVIKAKLAIEEAFFYELKQGFLSNLVIIDDCSIIAAVGDSINRIPGVAGLFFSALGNAGINILSLSQGCVERNISAVVKTADVERALRAVHSAFWLSSMEISIGIIGIGRVGSALLKALIEARNILAGRFDLKLKVRCIANSSKMILSSSFGTFDGTNNHRKVICDDLTDAVKDKIRFFTENKNEKGEYFMRKTYSKSQLSELNEKNASRQEPLKDSNYEFSDGGGFVVEDTDLSVFLSHLQSFSTPHSIIIDCSTSDEVALLHPVWLKAGSHVVTANKRALCSPDITLYNDVLQSSRIYQRLYMSEVTIGAALPIFSTLHDLLYSGDAITEIVGIMSVSANIVLTDICENNISFSQSVSNTFARGLFEDDVFKDLEGYDTAEKLVILGRELGISLSLQDIEIDPLAKRRPMLGKSFLDLGNLFEEEDRFYREKVNHAKEHNRTLRYLQRIRCFPATELGKRFDGIISATVKLEEVALDSPFAMIKGPVYYFAFYTNRYSQHPLVIQVIFFLFISLCYTVISFIFVKGPLSDSANTASGIIGDVLRIARSLGAKDRGFEELSGLGSLKSQSNSFDYGDPNR
jgi:aspartate kinase